MSLSVVMCTYNGASRHLAEQLDSIFSQTLLPAELIVQDDGSTDNTMDLLHSYAAKTPEGMEMRIFRNEKQMGINANFFSAMRRAKGDLIAVSDQDDIWMPTKLEEQAAAMADPHMMMCVCRSVPFSESGAEVRYDPRRPNCNLIRLFYASMMGHCQMLRRTLLDYIPSETEHPDIYRRTCYDVMTATAAAALDAICLIDRVLVRQRRYAEAATYVGVDAHRVRQADNALYMVWYGMCHWHKVKPWMRQHFAARLTFIEWVWRHEKAGKLDVRDGVTTNNPIYADALKLLHAECGTSPFSLLSLMRMYVKYRHVLFYTYEKDPIALLRALMHPFMQVYNYRYLVPKK